MVYLWHIYPAGHLLLIRISSLCVDADTVLQLQRKVFFERTTHECVSIDIAEKYKIMSLGGHNQEKEKRHGNNTDGLDWGLNTRQTQLDSNSGWLDWGVDTSHTTCLKTRHLSPVRLGHWRGQYTVQRRQKRSIADAANSLSHLLKSSSSHGPNR